MTMTDIGGGDNIDKNRWSPIMILIGGLAISQLAIISYLTFKSSLIQNLCFIIFKTKLIL